MTGSRFKKEKEPLKIAKLDKFPETIGPYKVIKFLEKGGMSLLFLAEATGHASPILIKTLSEQFLGNADAVKRFLEEAKIIKLADHPNIVPLLDSGTWEGGLFIVMEYIQGDSLRNILKTEPLSLKRALEIVLEIAYALCHLHAHHIIHRDLKPENILITRKKSVKVIDFGIAQMLYEGKSDLVQKKRFIGTPIYMSPEQKETPQKASYPSDIYSLGIITYELIIGKIIQGHIYLSLLPKGLQKIIAKTLQPDPKDRYQDMVDFVSDISDYFHSEKFLTDETPKDIVLNQLYFLKKRAKFWFNPPMPNWKGINFKLMTSNQTGPLFYNFFAGDKENVVVILKSLENSKADDLSTLIPFGAIKEAFHQTDKTLKGPSAYQAFIAKVLSDWKETPFLSFAIVSFQNEGKKISFSVGGDLSITLNTQEKTCCYPSDDPLLSLTAKPAATPKSLTLNSGNTLFIRSCHPEAVFSNPEESLFRLEIKV